MSIVLFFIILAVLVLIHEFGHFYAAKKSGVRVDEFGLGFPPRIWSKQIGETTYSLNAVPFGGFVKIFGENPDDESIAGPDKGRSFVHVSKIKQIIILAAGVFMNIVFAWVLFSIAFMSGMTTELTPENERYAENSHLLVAEVIPGSPAAKAGILAGDEIKNFGTTTFKEKIIASAGKPVSFTVERLSGSKEITVIPEKGVTGSDFSIGIAMRTVGNIHLPFITAFVEGGRLTIHMFGQITSGIYTLIHDAILGKADLSQVSGPVGIARLVDDAARLGVVYLLSFTAFISLNLAVLNLVPFPALDGGRILFVIVEAIIRRPISPKVANTCNTIGFALLIFFMLFVTYKDIVKLF